MADHKKMVRKQIDAKQRARLEDRAKTAMKLQVTGLMGVVKRYPYGFTEGKGFRKK